MTYVLSLLSFYLFFLSFLLSLMHKTSFVHRQRQIRTRREVVDSFFLIQLSLSLGSKEKRRKILKVCGKEEEPKKEEDEGKEELTLSMSRKQYILVH